VAVPKLGSVRRLGFVVWLGDAVGRESHCTDENSESAIAC
jgi:hypothetical protein